MKYLLLSLAIIFEINDPSFLQISNESTKIYSTFITIIALTRVFIFLSNVKVFPFRDRVCQLGQFRNRIN